MYSLQELMEGDPPVGRPALKLIEWKDGFVVPFTDGCLSVEDSCYFRCHRKLHALLDRNNLVIGYLSPGADSPGTWKPVVDEVTAALREVSAECPSCQYSVKGVRGYFKTLTVGITLGNGMEVSVCDTLVRHDARV